MNNSKCNFNFAKIASWNIHGVYEKTNGFKINKLEDPGFLKTLESHDILCVQETMCGQNDTPSDHITQFDSIPHCRKKSLNNRYFGGMLLLIRKSVRRGVKVTHSAIPEILGIKLSKEFFGLEDDLAVWFVYAPPLNSPYLKNSDKVLDQLEKLLTTNNTSIILGDLNGKTALGDDFIHDDTDKHSPVNEIDTYIHDTPLKRNNLDNNTIDKQGKIILEICKNLNLRILNGRTSGDRWGALTRFPLYRTEKPSLIDYGICSSTFLSNIRTFFVLPLGELSDHCCISMSITVQNRQDLTNLRKSESQTDKIIPYPKFDINLVENFKNNLGSDSQFQLLQDEITKNQSNPTQDEIDNWAESFKSQILFNANKTFPSQQRDKHSKKTKQRHKPTSWFNNECLRTKNKHKRALARLTKTPYDRHLQQDMVATRKEYKKTCKKAEINFRKKLLNKLLSIEASNPKQFWGLVKKMKEWGRESQDPSTNIPPDRWVSYFKNLLNTPNALPLEVPGLKQFIPEMDGKISLTELTEAVTRAKNGKACGPDGIMIEYIKHATENVIKTLLILMNATFCHVIYPKAWSINYLKTLYKKDAKDDPDNYRGLAIGSAIGKLYSMILLQRLEKFIDKNNLLSPNQIGFRKGFRTADHIYVLKTLVTKITKNKNTKLFVAFIDFKKAYDTVNRSKLLERLSKMGVGHKFLSNLKALYTNVEYIIKSKSSLSKPIPSNLGLKQGCPLSPLLFNLYIDDISEYIENMTDPDVSLQGQMISHFLYADDLVLLSTSKEGLQTKLDGLSKFAEDRDLTVNTKKSKIMVFNKTGRRYKVDIKINGNKLEVVQKFTYLGIDITSSGFFTSAIKELASKAKKAMMPLYRTIIQFQIPFRKSLKLFRTYIEPILLYNAENLSILTDKQMK